MARRSTFNRDGESSILLAHRRESVVRGQQTIGVVAERQRHLTVSEDQVGSTPIHFANNPSPQNSDSDLPGQGLLRSPELR